MFASAKRRESSNYGIGTDGRVGLYVDEANRSWCSSDAANDHRAVTIEVANDQIGGNWHVSDAALAKLVELCADICRRNGIKQLRFTGDKFGNLTMHKYFAATLCPGPYLEGKFADIAQQVNENLAPQNALYKVQVGAFSQKANADAMLQKLKAAGFTGFIKEE
ncbi:MAG: N-acetylmuramoyl-L-alanine amidase [Ruthenibacterium sp.]